MNQMFTFSIILLSILSFPHSQDTTLPPHWPMLYSSGLNLPTITDWQQHEHGAIAVFVLKKRLQT